MPKPTCSHGAPELVCFHFKGPKIRGKPKLLLSSSALSNAKTPLCIEMILLVEIQI
jgi:hypothetical protein